MREISFHSFSLELQVTLLRLYSLDFQIIPENCRGVVDISWLLFWAIVEYLAKNLNPLILNVTKWSDTVRKYCSKCKSLHLKFRCFISFYLNFSTSIVSFSFYSSFHGTVTWVKIHYKKPCYRIYYLISVSTHIYFSKPRPIISITITSIFTLKICAYIHHTQDYYYQQTGNGDLVIIFQWLQLNLLEKLVHASINFLSACMYASSYRSFLSPILLDISHKLLINALCSIFLCSFNIDR